MKQLKTKGFLVVLGAVLLQLCIGSIYSWSLFNEPIATYLDISKSKVVLTFSITVFVFAFVTIFSGKLQDKIGPKRVAMIGGAFYSIGLFLCSKSTSLLDFYIYYGVVAGIGIGFVYVCPLSTCIKWFPNHKGLVTGISVGAFGLGSLVFNPLIQSLLASMGISKTFLFLSIINLILILLGSNFLSLPDESLTVKNNVVAINKNYTPMEMVKTKSFPLLWIAYLFGTMSGLLVIGLARDIGIELAGLSASTAATAVSAVAIFNATGRLFWGTLSDKIGRIKVLTILFRITTVCMVLKSVLTLNIISYFLTLGGVTFCFGGFLSVYPTITGDFFGLKNLGSNYGIMYQAYGIAALVGPLISAGAGNLKVTFIISAILSFIGLIISLFIKSPFRKADSI